MRFWIDSVVLSRVFMKLLCFLLTVFRRVVSPFVCPALKGQVAISSSETQCLPRRHHPEDVVMFVSLCDSESDFSS